MEAMENVECTVQQVFHLDSLVGISLDMPQLEPTLRGRRSGELRE